MAVSIILIKMFMGDTRLSLCLMLAIGILVYAVALYVSGEVKNEVKAILNVIKRR